MAASGKCSRPRRAVLWGVELALTRQSPRPVPKLPRRRRRQGEDGVLKLHPFEVGRRPRPPGRWKALCIRAVLYAARGVFLFRSFVEAHGEKCSLDIYYTHAYL